MADIFRLHIKAELISADGTPPKTYDLFRTVDESAMYRIELAAGATDQSLVLTGTGGIETYQCLLVIVDRACTIRPGGGSTTTFTITGTPQDPAAFLLWRTSQNVTPTISNNDLSNITNVVVVAGGT